MMARKSDTLSCHNFLPRPAYGFLSRHFYPSEWMRNGEGRRGRTNAETANRTNCSSRSMGWTDGRRTDGRWKCPNLFVRPLPPPIVMLDVSVVSFVLLGFIAGRSACAKRSCQVDGHRGAPRDRRRNGFEPDIGSVGIGYQS